VSNNDTAVLNLKNDDSLESANAYYDQLEGQAVAA
jgi:hypothetical protein